MPTNAKPEPAAPSSQPRTWLQMRERIEQILVRRTGEGVAVWAARVRELGDVDEAHVRAWLTAEGVAGYPQMLLVMERFGYPDFMLASADELVDGQYADRPQLRPILDEVLLRAAEIGEVDVQARKTWMTLLTPRRTFALVRATTRDRIDVGLRLPDATPGGRLLTAPALGNDYVNVRIALRSVDEVDDAFVDYLKLAYQANIYGGAYSSSSMSSRYSTISLS